MTTTAVPFAIHKKKAPPAIRLARNAFVLPQNNRYFARVMGDRGVLAKSQCDNQEQMEDKSRVVEQGSRTEVIRSASLQLSRKVSMMRDESREGKTQSQMQLHSLPKLQSRLIRSGHTAPIQGVPPREIIKSELGCFSTFDILRKRQEKSQKRRLGNHLTRLSSLFSQQELPLDAKNPHDGETAQKEYDQYDRALMEPQPVIYKQRIFKLKHKADWSISLK